MSVPSEDDRAAEELLLRGLAQQLRDLSTTTAGAGHVESILGFAAQADIFADRIRDAATPEMGVAIAIEVSAKRAQWIELMEMLTLATQVEGIEGTEGTEDIENMEGIGEAMAEAEAKLRNTASQLRAVAGRGETSVFGAIGAIAAEAEAGLADFLAAETIQEKYQVFARVEESRARWLAQMEDMHSNVADGSDSQAPTEAPDPLDPVCEYVDESTYASCVAAVAPSGGVGGYTSSFGGGCAPVAGGFHYGGGCTSLSSAATATPEPVNSEPAPRRLAAPPELAVPATAQEAREQLVVYLQDKEEGLLVTLRKAVAKVRDDERFEGVHEDAAKLLEQMELAAGAIIPEALVQEEFSDDLAGAEDKLKATVEPMRKAQWGGFYAKKAAFAVRKYDLYKRKGKMPKLSDEHADLIQCAEVSVDLAEYLRKEAQGAIMDSVTGLVAQTTR